MKVQARERERGREREDPDLQEPLRRQFRSEEHLQRRQQHRGGRARRREGQGGEHAPGHEVGDHCVGMRGRSLDAPLFF